MPINIIIGKNEIKTFWKLKRAFTSWMAIISLNENTQYIKPSSLEIIKSYHLNFQK